MKILVVSESFNNGGLETQIKTMHDNLNDNIEMVFAFAKYTKQIELSNAKIYEGFHFSYSSTIKEFCEDVDKLVKIIKDEKIDVIHVHPYYSLFPAIFASQLTNTKMVYSYHGIGSFNFTKSVIGSILFYYCFAEHLLSKVFSVNTAGINIFKNIGFSDVTFLPNPIDINKFSKANVVKNGRWAIFSRIDVDKFEEIKMIINNMDEYGIKKIDIYGSGSEKEKLLDYINENNLNDKIYYKGYSTNIFETLNNNYNGVMGIGRVLIESMTMGYPSILIGYNKITGFINYKVYNEIKDTNFINMKYNKINKEYPSDIDLLRIRKSIIKRCSVNNIIKVYEREIKNCESTFLANIKSLYDDLVKLSENKDLSNCSFFMEREVYKLMVKYIGKYSTSPIIDNLITNTDMSYSILDVSFNRIQEMKGMIKNGKN